MEAKEIFKKSEIAKNDYVLVENVSNELADESWLVMAYDDFCVISNNH